MVDEDIVVVVVAAEEEEKKRVVGRERLRRRRRMVGVGREGKGGRRIVGVDGWMMGWRKGRWDGWKVYDDETLTGPGPLC